MKTCPICQQEIHDAAIKCRYCKNWLVSSHLGGDAYPGVCIQPPNTSGMAIASMVLGILWIYWVGSIVALILGYLALREIRRDPQRIEGRGMAIAGIILGWVGIVTLVLVLIVGVYALHEDQKKDSAPEPVRAALHRG
jgi:hypothetical protein